MISTEGDDPNATSQDAPQVEQPVTRSWALENWLQRKDSVAEVEHLNAQSDPRFNTEPFDLDAKEVHDFMSEPALSVDQDPIDPWTHGGGGSGGGDTKNDAKDANSNERKSASQKTTPERQSAADRGRTLKPKPEDRRIRAVSADNAQSRMMASATTVHSSQYPQGPGLHLPPHVSGPPPPPTPQPYFQGFSPAAPQYSQPTAYPPPQFPYPVNYAPPYPYPYQYPNPQQFRPLQYAGQPQPYPYPQQYPGNTMVPQQHPLGTFSRSSPALANPSSPALRPGTPSPLSQIPITQQRSFPGADNRLSAPIEESGILDPDVASTGARRGSEDHQHHVMMDRASTGGVMGTVPIVHTDFRRLSIKGAYHSMNATYGRLYKQGRMTHVLVQRLYYLKGLQLMYVPSGESEPILVTAVSSGSEVEGPMSRGKYVGFVLRTSTHTVPLFAKTKDECLVWMRALEAAISQASAYRPLS